MDFEGAKENAAKLGESVTQTITGVDNLGQKISNAAKNTNKFFKESARLGKELADIQVEIQETENDMVIKRALLNSEYEKQREIAQDVKYSEEERKKAIERAIEIQNELLDAEQGVLDMKIRQKEIENSLNDTLREDQKELNELIAQRTNFEADAARKRARSRNLEKTIDNEIESKRIEAAKKEVDAALKASKDKLDAALKASKDKLDIYIAENEGKAKTLNQQLQYEKQVYNQKTELLKQQLEADKITQAEYDIETLNNKKELAQKQAEITSQHAQKELDLYIATNKSNIDSQTQLTDELVKQEQQRLNSIYEKQMEFLEQEKENKLISEEDFQLQKLDLQAQYLEQEKALQDSFRQQKDEARQLELDREQADWETSIELKALRGESEYQLQLQQLDREQELKRQKAIEEGTWSVKQEELYAEKRKAIVEAETLARLSEYSNMFGGISQLLGEQTAAGKAAGIAQATINTYQGVSEVWKTPSTIPEPMATISRVVNTGVVLGSGLKAVSKIASVKAEKGATFEIGGKRHSAGGTKFYGEDGTAFEAEKGETMFILNRIASQTVGPYLSRINQMYGGVPLSRSSSYLASGGAVSRVATGVQSVNVKSRGAVIDYEKLSTMIAAKNGEQFIKLPRPVTDVKDVIREVDNYNDVINGASF